MEVVYKHDVFIKDYNSSFGPTNLISFTITNEVQKQVNKSFSIQKLLLPNIKVKKHFQLKF